jgi:hypothetical protein
MASKSMKIDLGKKPMDTPIPAGPDKKSSKVFYPSLHIGDIEGLDKLPSGEFNFTGRGKVVHKSVTERNGKKSCSCEIEVMHLSPEGSDEEDGLDKELEKIASKKTGKSMKQIEDEEDN